MSSVSSRSRLSLVRYGERGGGDVWRPVLVPVAVRMRSDDMWLMAATECYQVPAVACLPYRLAPLFDKMDGE